MHIHRLPHIATFSGQAVDDRATRCYCIAKWQVRAACISCMLYFDSSCKLDVALCTTQSAAVPSNSLDMQHGCLLPPFSPHRRDMYTCCRPCILEEFSLLRRAVCLLHTQHTAEKCCLQALATAQPARQCTTRIFAKHPPGSQHPHLTVTANSAHPTLLYTPQYTRLFPAS
jgi:hypothetical protein